MKARVVIIALVLSLSIFALTCKNRSENNIGEKPNRLSFAKYYEPYEIDIKPEAAGYQLPLDMNDIVNVDKIKIIVDYYSISDLIKQNGFAILETEPYAPLDYVTRIDFVSIYKLLGEGGILPFITSDTGLYLYHTLFDETLKDIEENEFIPNISDLTIVLHKDVSKQYEQLEGDLKEAARRNIAYLSVANKLLNPDAFIPELVNNIVSDELDKIQARSGFKSSNIFIYEEDFSQYVPRGHYTESDELKSYFKTMMWYGRMAFLLRGGTGGLISKYDAKIQTLQALLLSWSLKNVQVGERNGLDIWDRIYTVTSFHVGLADDLTPYDYLWALDQVFRNDFRLSDLTDASNLFKLKTKLTILPSPKIYGGTGNIILSQPITTKSLDKVLNKTKGMRLMGRRFAPDSYMFQHIAFPEVGNYLGYMQELPFTAVGDNMGGYCRGYIRGLDLMALLGSDEALKILNEEGDTDYKNYKRKFGEIKNELDSLSLTEWNANLYWSWLYCLRALLQELPEGYPEFMRTKAWNRRQLNTALASWAQLRRDTVLYTKQGYPPPPAARLPAPPPGYVEPNPLFWGRLLSLIRMSYKGLDDLNVLKPEFRRRFIEFERLVKKILDITGKQLNNNPLLSEDREFFKKLPSRLRTIVTDIKGDCLSTTFVVDVLTNPLENKVVEEATGKIDLVIVACPMPEGKAFLAIGPVFSYYEFKHPMSDRLTDKSWRLMLDSPNKPERPKWYIPLMRLME